MVHVVRAGFSPFVRLRGYGIIDLTIQYRQDLAPKRIHAWLLHTSLARLPPSPPPFPIFTNGRR